MLPQRRKLEGRPPRLAAKEAPTWAPVRKARALPTADHAQVRPRSVACRPRKAPPPSSGQRREPTKARAKTRAATELSRLTRTRTRRELARTLTAQRATAPPRRTRIR